MYIDQEMIKDKTNEIPTIKKFCLKILNEVKRVENRSLKRIRKSMSRSIEKECIEIFKIMRNFDIESLS